VPADNASGVAEPFYVSDVAELAQKLAVGFWVVFRHEHLGDVCDLDTWTAVLRDACEQIGVVERVVTIPRKDLTVVFNAEKVPSAEQVQASVSRAELDRWIARELRPELETRPARGE
jgi:ribosomal protein L7Ae-like RNA K-turn-binding protein